MSGRQTGSPENPTSDPIEWDDRAWGLADELCRQLAIDPSRLRHALHGADGDGGARVALLAAQARLDGYRAGFDDLGRLAHQINNPLSVLSGRAQLLELTPPGQQVAPEIVAQIGESARQVADLVRELSQRVRQLREGPPD